MSHAIAVPVEDVGWLRPGADRDAAEMARLGFLAGYKGRTLECYRHDIGLFYGFCAAHGLNPLEAQRPHVMLYIRWLESQGWAAATVNRRYTTVSSFYRTITRDRLIDRNPCEFIDAPKVDLEAQRRPAPSPLELGIFLDAAEKVGTLELALLVLLGVRGLRISEACSLDVEDLTRSRDGYDQVTFIGKGGATFTEVLPVPAARAVRRHVGDRTEGPLLLNKRGRRLDRHAAQRAIDRVAAAAHQRQDLTPHSFRRGMVLTLLASGASLRDTQLAARHKQSSTTERYDVRRRSADRDATHGLAAHLMGMRTE